MKNVILMAMSTLRINGEKEIDGDLFRFQGDPEDRGYVYYSQLEPISRMIRRREGSLDYVVMLATKEARNGKNDWTTNSNSKAADEEEIRVNKGELIDIPADDPEGLSAAAYYMRRLGFEPKDPRVEIVELDEKNAANAINGAVGKLREYWRNEKDEKQLWIDTQGAQRNVNMVMNAVVSLLGEAYDMKDNSPHVNAQFSIAYISKNSVSENRKKNPEEVSIIPHEIIDQTNSYRVFDFVAGINELAAYGRADKLDKYYTETREDQPVIVRDMKKLAEAIQMCDMDAFDVSRKKLKDNWAKEANAKDLFGIFKNTIKEDYGDLLAENCDALDVIEWLCKKKFYFQALSYIESRMPQKWVKDNVLSYEVVEGTVPKEKHEVLENVETRALILTLFEKTSIYEIKDKKKSKPKKNIKKSMQFLAGKKGGPKARCEVTFRSNNLDNVWEVLFLYRILKEERNLMAHLVSEKYGTDHHASEAALRETIDEFVRRARKMEAQPKQKDTRVISKKNTKAQNQEKPAAKKKTGTAMKKNERAGYSILGDAIADALAKQKS